MFEVESSNDRTHVSLHVFKSVDLTNVESD